MAAGLISSDELERSKLPDDPWAPLSQIIEVLMASPEVKLKTPEREREETVIMPEMHEN